MLAEHWRNLDPEERERRLAGLNRGTYVRDEEWRDRASLAATAWWRGKDRPAFKDKVCRGCDRAFTPNSGVQVYCTPACRDQNAQPAKYGITAATASKMLERQGGGCGICGRVPQLHIDHDHATGKVRGLLCVSCNTALGKFDESIERLQAAIDYLRRASV